jgi:hypothetical protein
MIVTPPRSERGGFGPIAAGKAAGPGGFGPIGVGWGGSEEEAGGAVYEEGLAVAEGYVRYAGEAVMLGCPGQELRLGVAG